MVLAVKKIKWWGREWLQEDALAVREDLWAEGHLNCNQLFQGLGEWSSREKEQELLHGQSSAHLHYQLAKSRFTPLSQYSSHRRQCKDSCWAHLILQRKWRQTRVLRGLSHDHSGVGVAETTRRNLREQALEKETRSLGAEFSSTLACCGDIA